MGVYNDGTPAYQEVNSKSIIFFYSSYIIQSNNLNLKGLGNKNHKTYNPKIKSSVNAFF